MIRINPYKTFIAVLTAFLLSGNVFGQGGIERYLKATEILETNLHFIYQGVYTPVPDQTYHEFSSDSLSWRKSYQEGDCYVRFANTTSNTTNPYTGYQGYHDDWWVFNFCTCNGAIEEGGGGIDTLFVYYYQSDTVYTIDTVVVAGDAMDINIPYPDTVSGTSTNYQDTSYHTHELYVYLNDLEDVDTTGVENGYVIKYNSVTGEWEPAADLTGTGAGGELTMQELDGFPDVDNVTTIVVSNNHLEQLGAGKVFLNFPDDPVNSENDYWRTDTVRVGPGDSFIEFSSAFSENDYILPGIHGVLDGGNRQDLQADSLQTDGFKVLSLVDSAWVHYIAIRNVDSLLSTYENIGKIYSTASDTTLEYLNQVVDDSTITVINQDLTVLPSGLNIRDMADVGSTELDTVGQILVWNNDSNHFDADYNLLEYATRIELSDTADILRSEMPTMLTELDSIGFRITESQISDLDHTANIDTFMYSTGGDSIWLSLNNDTLYYLDISDLISKLDTVAIDSTLTGDGTNEFPLGIDESILENAMKTVYRITLPINGTLSGSALAATDVPDGWSLSVSGGDLQINHGLGRYSSAVNIRINTSGSSYRQLRNFDNAYSGILDVDSNNLTIESISTFYTAYALRITIIFE